MSIEACKLISRVKTMSLVSNRHHLITTNGLIPTFCRRPLRRHLCLLSHRASTPTCPRRPSASWGPRTTTSDIPYRTAPPTSSSTAMTRRRRSYQTRARPLPTSGSPGPSGRDPGLVCRRRQKVAPMSSLTKCKHNYCMSVLSDEPDQPGKSGYVWRPSLRGPKTRKFLATSELMSWYFAIFSSLSWSSILCRPNKSDE